MGRLSRTFFSPTSIAVIGASESSGKIGSRIMKTLIERKFAGPLYPVNSTRASIHGYTAYPSVTALPTTPDLALMCIPAAQVPDTMEESARAGIKNFVVVSSGFAEEGAEGLRLQDRLMAIGREQGLLIAGPNSEGFYNVPAQIAATFSPAVHIDIGRSGPQRRIGIIAQSGGLGFALFNRGRREGLEFSMIFSIGNQVDLEVNDYAEALLDDPETHVILIFIEGLKNPERFKTIARRAAALGKPVIVAKVGGSEAGQRAVASHTGSLSGSESAYDAIFRRYGVIRVGSQEDMIDIAAMFTRYPQIKGNRVAIISSSGGTAAWLSDTVEAHGFRLPVIDAGRQKQLMTFIPAYGSSANPIDLTGQGMNGISRSLQVLQDSPDLDAIIVCGSFAHEGRLSLEGEAIREISSGCDKPIVLFSYTIASEISRALLADLGLHHFSSMNGVSKALQAGLRRTLFEQGDVLADLDERAGWKPPMAPCAGSVLCEYEAAELLGRYGIETAGGFLAQTAEEAISAADRLGWPVAAKIQSPDIPHKTEAGGVALGLNDPEALRAAADRILESAKAYAPDGDIRGVLIQTMARPGLELIAGVKSDPDFGPIVMCGLGGIFVEIYKDVAFGPAPLTRSDAARMLSELKAAPLMNGYRGKPALDLRAMEDLLVRLSEFAHDNRARIAEIDLNPVLLHERGVSVVDALILLKASHNE